MSGAEMAATLNAVSADSGNNYEFWVASGDYKPTTDADRAKSFTLSKGVKLYGGFAGNETALASRDIKANTTYLSGEIGGSGNTDNSHHVVYASGNMGAETRLDGFTITGGGYDEDNADGAVYGGGMYNVGASPTVENCVFEDNYLYVYSTAAHGGIAYGGAMCNVGANPTVKNCTFKNNTAFGGITAYGGGMCNLSSSPVIVNCTFKNNEVNDGRRNNGCGGGIYNKDNSSPVVVNCTFEGNSASSYGGGMYNAANTSPVVANCIFWDNSANQSGREVYNAGSLTITNSVVGGDSIYHGGGSVNKTNVTSADPVLGNLAGNGGPVPTIQISAGGGAYRAGLAPGERTFNGKAFIIPAADARGVAFDTTSADIGAYSYVAESVTLTLDKNAISGDETARASVSVKLTGTASADTNLNAVTFAVLPADVVSIDAQTGVVTGLAAGTATITAASKADASKTAAKSITVSRSTIAPDTTWYTGHESATSYDLTTRVQLAGLASLVNDNTTFSGKTIRLGNNIDLQGGKYDWTPIGASSADAFMGTFDGQGHSITGLFVSGDAEYQGLFGVIADAENGAGKGTPNLNSGHVKNLTVSGDVTGGKNVGIIAGAVIKFGETTPIIENCLVMGNASGTDNVGGIVGLNTGYDYEPGKIPDNRKGSTIINCASTVAVTATGEGGSAGGIVGRNKGGEVYNCAASGPVSANGTLADAGGVAGCNTNYGQYYGYVQKCAATGEVSASGTSGDVGGVVGEHVSGTISSLYWVRGTGRPDVPAQAGPCSYVRDYASYDVANSRDIPVVTVLFDEYKKETDTSGGFDIAARAYPEASKQRDNLLFENTTIAFDPLALSADNTPTNAAISRGKVDMTYSVGFTTEANAATKTPAVALVGKFSLKANGIKNIACTKAEISATSLDIIDYKDVQLKVIYTPANATGSADVFWERDDTEAFDLVPDVPGKLHIKSRGRAEVRAYWDDGTGRTANMELIGSCDVAVRFARSGTPTQVHRVTVNGGGKRDGTTWADALSGADMANILNAIRYDQDKSIPAPVEFWVASGDYRPTADGDRSKSFVLSQRIKLYGGFAGNEASIASRDVSKNRTILNGDIGRKDDPSDNSYHVVILDAKDATREDTILDGFTIKNGYADGTAKEDQNGGGLYLVREEPLITNCTFIDNYAADAGGGLYGSDGKRPTVTNCAFINNSAGQNGGGMRNFGTNSIVMNCTFSGNYAKEEGGGMYNSAASPIVVSCTFAGNKADGGTTGARQGSAMRNIISGHPVVANCVFWNPDALHEIRNSGGATASTDLSIDNSVVREWKVTVDNTAYSRVTSKDCLTTDPLLGATADNGGPARTIQFSAAGSAFDKGLPVGTEVGCYESGGGTIEVKIPSADARGVAKQTNDVGAYGYVVESATVANPAISGDKFLTGRTGQTAVVSASVDVMLVNTASHDTAAGAIALEIDGKVISADASGVITMPGITTTGTYPLYFVETLGKDAGGSRVVISGAAAGTTFYKDVTFNNINLAATKTQMCPGDTVVITASNSGSDSGLESWKVTKWRGNESFETVSSTDKSITLRAKSRSTIGGSTITAAVTGGLSGSTSVNGGSNATIGIVKRDTPAAEVTGDTRTDNDGSGAIVVSTDTIEDYAVYDALMALAANSALYPAGLGSPGDIHAIGARSADIKTGDFYASADVRQAIAAYWNLGPASEDKVRLVNVANTIGARTDESLWAKFWRFIFGSANDGGSDYLPLQTNFRITSSDIASLPESVKNGLNAGNLLASVDLFVVVADEGGAKHARSLGDIASGDRSAFITISGDNASGYEVSTRVMLFDMAGGVKEAAGPGARWVQKFQVASSDKRANDKDNYFIVQDGKDDGEYKLATAFACKEPNYAALHVTVGTASGDVPASVDWAVSGDNGYNVSNITSADWRNAAVSGDAEYAFTFPQYDGYTLTVTPSGTQRMAWGASLDVTALYNQIHVESVSLNKTSAALDYASPSSADSVQLAATVVPAEALVKDVTWKSSDENIAAVDQTGKVTATGRGTATITVTAGDGGKTAACAVTVTQRLEGAAVAVTTPADTIIYNGAEIKPAVSVTINNKAVDAADYTVAYSGNTDAGAATATITGRNQYAGSAGQSFTILPRDITVTADAQTITYGDAIAQNKATLANAVSGHSVKSAALTQSITDVGSGTITPAAATIKDAAGNDVSANYNITAYNAGTLTIGKRTLTVTAKAQSITYGGTISQGASNYTAAGLVNGENAAVTLSTADTNVTQSGTITPRVTAITGGGASAANYDVRYVSGTLTITQKALTVTAKAQTITYGEAIATGAAQATAATLVNGESLTTVTLTPSTEDATQSGDITPSNAVVKAGGVDTTANYTISYVKGKLIINAKALTNATIAAIPDQTYSGAAITPALTVKDGTVTLAKDKDYTAAYTDNTNAGTANVAIAFKGNYSGT
ncbi:MAG: Ig-like domain-containing protein, partial [bacterium]|nr:Ig-like domain-containing protein [bacterium]